MEKKHPPPPPQKKVRFTITHKYAILRFLLCSILVWSGNRGALPPTASSSCYATAIVDHENESLRAKPGCGKKTLLPRFRGGDLTPRLAPTLMLQSKLSQLKHKNNEMSWNKIICWDSNQKCVRKLYPTTYNVPIQFCLRKGMTVDPPWPNNCLAQLRQTLSIFTDNFMLKKMFICHN